MIPIANQAIATAGPHQLTPVGSDQTFLNKVAEDDYAKDRDRDLPAAHCRLPGDEHQPDRCGGASAAWSLRF
jgi:hypothetical protein